MKDSNKTWTQLTTGVASDRATLDDVTRNFSQQVAIVSPDGARIIASEGNPALGWIEQLDLIGEDEAQPELWALVRWLDTSAREKVESGHLLLQAIIARGTNPSTGLPTGARLHSVHIFPTTVDDMNELTPKEKPMNNNEIEETEVQTILTKLPVYLKRHPTVHLAIAACVRDTIPRTRLLSHHQLWSAYVAPQKTAAVTRAVASGAPVRASVVRPAPGVRTVATPAAKPQRAQLDVRMSMGRNPFEKLLNHVKLSHPQLNHDQAFAHACTLNRSHEVVG